MVGKKYYKFINSFPSVKEYEDWKKKNGIDLEKVTNKFNETMVYGPLAKNKDFLTEPVELLKEKFKGIVKTEDARRLVALLDHISSSKFSKYDNLDKFILGNLIWQETKSVKDLYEMTHLRSQDQIVAGAEYDDTINFLKANGEEFDATNPTADEWCKRNDEEFDFKERMFELEEKAIKESVKRLSNAGRDGK